MRTKIGCTYEKAQIPFLSEVDVSQDIAAILKILCEHFRVSDSENFALKVSNNFVTEENKGELLVNGVVCNLVQAPSAIVRDALGKANSSSDSLRREGLNQVLNALKDPAIAPIIVEQKGVGLFSGLLQSKKEDSMTMQLTTRILENLAQQNVLEMTTLSKEDINTVMGFLNQNDDQLLNSSCKLLYRTITSGGPNVQLVRNGIPLEILCSLITANRATSTEAALQLLIEILQEYSDPDEALKLVQEQHVLSSLSARKEGMKSLLVQFQNIYMRHISKHIPFDEKNQNHKTLLDNLLSQIPPEANNNIKILGFTNSESPTDDFKEPPGILTLTCLNSYIENHPETLQRFLLEMLSRPEQYVCPLVQIAKSIVNILLELMGVFNDKSHQHDSSDGHYVPLFFSSDQAFDEMFSASIDLFNKTWREMEAKLSDINKVIYIGKRQLSIPLQQVSTIREFAARLSEMHYNTIHGILLDEFVEEESIQLESVAMKELRSQVLSTAQEVVKRQRLARLCEGAWFQVPGTKGKKVRYVILSQNHKLLHWSEPKDSPQTSSIPPHQLENSSDPREINHIYQGEEVREIPDLNVKIGKNEDLSLTFVISSNRIENGLVLQANSPSQAACWKDGLRTFFTTMRESESNNLINQLERLDLRLHQLYLHGLDLPNEVPQVPDLPEDLQFSIRDGDDTEA